MAVNKVNVHMNAGDGEASYTNNSAPQKIGISKSLNVLDEALKDMLTENGFPKCFRMVDLGCASGPNTFSIVSRVIGVIEGLCRENDHNPSPEFEVILSDLPGNDFNNLFKRLPDFYQKLNQGTRCFVSCLPGSFHGRLFPSNSLDFVHSSYSLHWLSQVPEGLESNRENIHIRRTSPPEVLVAYREQYRRDLSAFLKSRSEEMVPRARMVLTFVGGSFDHDVTKEEGSLQFTLLANTLADMVAEGLVKEADLHSFNLPMHAPMKQEVEEIVSGEGSFNLDKLEEFVLPWDVHVPRGMANLDKYKRGELVSKFIRAFTEPILAAHFGSSIMDEVFERYGKKIAELGSRELPPFPNMTLCLSKR